MYLVFLFSSLEWVELTNIGFIKTGWLENIKKKYVISRFNISRSDVSKKRIIDC